MVIHKKSRRRKDWYRSERIRKNVYLGTTASVTLVKFFGYDRKFGLGVDLVPSADLAELVMFVIVPVAAAATGLWLAVWGIIRRVRDGNDPTHPDLPISEPRAVRATTDVVRRMTS